MRSIQIRPRHPRARARARVRARAKHPRLSRPLTTAPMRSIRIRPRRPRARARARAKHPGLSHPLMTVPMTALRMIIIMTNPVLITTGTAPSRCHHHRGLQMTTIMSNPVLITTGTTPPRYCHQHRRVHWKRGWVVVNFFPRCPRIGITRNCCCFFVLPTSVISCQVVITQFN